MPFCVRRSTREGWGVPCGAAVETGGVMTGAGVGRTGAELTGTTAVDTTGSEGGRVICWGVTGCGVGAGIATGRGAGAVTGRGGATGILGAGGSGWLGRTPTGAGGRGWSAATNGRAGGAVLSCGSCATLGRERRLESTSAMPAMTRRRIPMPITSSGNGMPKAAPEILSPEKYPVIVAIIASSADSLGAGVGSTGTAVGSGVAGVAACVAGLATTGDGVAVALGVVRGVAAGMVVTPPPAVVLLCGEQVVLTGLSG